MQMGPDLGCVQLGQTLTAAVVVEDSLGVPRDPATPPSFRVYGQSASPMPNGLGSAAKLDVGPVTGATNATPIVVTSASHGLNTGTRVSVSGVAGNTAADAETTVTVIDANTFSLDGTAGNGAYAGGGQWHVDGLYQVTKAINGGDGYQAGLTYWLLLSWTIAGVNYACLCPFQVI